MHTVYELQLKLHYTREPTRQMQRKFITPSNDTENMSMVPYAQFTPPTNTGRTRLSHLVLVLVGDVKELATSQDCTQ